MKVSVAMTTYNGEKYVAEQLESILKQSRTPDEIVIYDDCSNDQTTEICERFASTSLIDIKIYKNKSNVGHTKNFERVIKKCDGDIILLCDQDDVWKINKIEEIINYFDNNKVDLVIHDLEECDHKLRKVGQSRLEKLGNVRNHMKEYVSGMATAVRKNFILLCYPLPETFFHDYWIHWVARICKTKKIMYKKLAFYRNHNESVTGSNGKNLKVNSFIRIKNFIKKKLNILRKEKLMLNIERLEIKNKWLEKNKDQLLYTYISNFRYQMIKYSIIVSRLKLVLIKKIL